MHKMSQRLKFNPLNSSLYQVELYVYTFSFQWLNNNLYNRNMELIGKFTWTK